MKTFEVASTRRRITELNAILSSPEEVWGMSADTEIAIEMAESMIEDDPTCTNGSKFAHEFQNGLKRLRARKLMLDNLQTELEFDFTLPDVSNTAGDVRRGEFQQMSETIDEQQEERRISMEDRLASVGLSRSTVVTMWLMEKGLFSFSE